MSLKRNIAAFVTRTADIKEDEREHEWNEQVVKNKHTQWELDQEMLRGFDADIVRAADDQRKIELDAEHQYQLDEATRLGDIADVKNRESIRAWLGEDATDADVEALAGLPFDYVATRLSQDKDTYKDGTWTLRADTLRQRGIDIAGQYRPQEIIDDAIWANSAYVKMLSDIAASGGDYWTFALGHNVVLDRDESGKVIGARAEPKVAPTGVGETDTVSAQEYGDAWEALGATMSYLNEATSGGITFVDNDGNIIGEYPGLISRKNWILEAAERRRNQDQLNGQPVKNLRTYVSNIWDVSKFGFLLWTEEATNIIANEVDDAINNAPIAEGEDDRVRNRVKAIKALENRIASNGGYDDALDEKLKADIAILQNSFGEVGESIYDRLVAEEEATLAVEAAAVAEEARAAEKEAAIIAAGGVPEANMEGIIAAAEPIVATPTRTDIARQRVEFEDLTKSANNAITELKRQLTGSLSIPGGRAINENIERVEAEIAKLTDEGQVIPLTLSGIPTERDKLLVELDQLQAEKQDAENQIAAIRAQVEELRLKMFSANVDPEAAPVPANVAIPAPVVADEGPPAAPAPARVALEANLREITTNVEFEEYLAFIQANPDIDTLESRIMDKWELTSEQVKQITILAIEYAKHKGE